MTMSHHAITCRVFFPVGSAARPLPAVEQPAPVADSPSPSGSGISGLRPGLEPSVRVSSKPTTPMVVDCVDWAVTCGADRGIVLAAWSTGKSATVPPLVPAEISTMDSVMLCEAIAAALAHCTRVWWPGSAAAAARGVSR